MPEICRFYGIMIYLYYNDHQPPHFHVIYAEYEAMIEIQTLTVFAGRLPPRALGLVVEWASVHQEELMKDWEKAANHQKLDKIEPLQ